MSKDPNTSYLTVQAELVQQSRYLIEYQIQRGSTLTSDLNTELKAALAHLWVSAQNDVEFPFMKDGVPFDWRVFETGIRS